MAVIENQKGADGRKSRQDTLARLEEKAINKALTRFGLNASQAQINAILERLKGGYDEFLTLPAQTNNVLNDGQQVLNNGSTVVHTVS